jgi:Fe-S cluster assembly protein SufD
MNLQEQLTQDFTRYSQQAEQDSFFETRRKAFEAFGQLGFPTTRHEEWKYTSLKQITDQQFERISTASSAAGSLLKDNAIYNLPVNKLVFVNGVLETSLSSVSEKDAGIVISTITQARKGHASTFDKHFAQYARFENESLNALNTALLTDGPFIHIPSGKAPELPVLIVHIADASTANTLQQPRSLMVVDENASVKVIELFLATGSNASFTNCVNEIYVADNASFEHYRIQEEAGEAYHNNYTIIHQEKNTTTNQVTLTLNGKLVRNNLHFYMNGQHSGSTLYGLYIPDGSNHVDNHSRVDHAVPNCVSDEKYKGVLKDKSTAVFNGKIIVHKDAQKTNAYQRNQNILLSEDATINTKPQLEIFADDVKCTHGATIGQLDEEAMFYLRARGIGEVEARRLLLNAFADEIAERIHIPELVDILEQRISEKL